MASIQCVPTLFSRVVSNYKYDSSFIGDNVQAIELGISSHCFKNDAQGWSQFSSSVNPKVLYYVEMYIKLIAELAFQTKKAGFPTAITCELVPRRTSTARRDLPIAVSDDIKQCSMGGMVKDFVGMRLRLAVNFNSRGIRESLEDFLISLLRENERYQKLKKKKAKKSQTILEELPVPVYRKMTNVLKCHQPHLVSDRTNVV